MKTFTDAAGRSWTVTINVDAVKRVRSLLKINLLDVVGDSGKQGGVLDQLADAVTLVDVLYCLVKPEADAKGVSDVQFGEAMLGDALDNASVALLEELADFFPSRQRALLKKAMLRAAELATAAVKQANKILDDPKLSQLPETTPGDSAGSSPESSGSAPAS